MSSTPPPGPLLSLRAALVLLIAVVMGLVAAGLADLSTHSPAAAGLVGFGAAGAALSIFERLTRG